MCKCTLNIRTPFCGVGDCKWENEKGEKVDIPVDQKIKEEKEYFIIQNKKWRKELDAFIQEIKNSSRKTRERSIVVTKLQEAVMWLGMDLKDLGTENPYPNSKDPSNTIIEPTADGLKL